MGLATLCQPAKKLVIVCQLHRTHQIISSVSNLMLPLLLSNQIQSNTSIRKTTLYRNQCFSFSSQPNMAAPSSSSFFIQTFFFLLLLFTLSPLPVSATDHIVGANRGWNPGINYTLWANNHTFYVGDFICKYPSQISSSQLNTLSIFTVFFILFFIDLFILNQCLISW